MSWMKLAYDGGHWGGLLTVTSDFDRFTFLQSYGTTNYVVVEKKFKERKKERKKKKTT